MFLVGSPRGTSLIQYPKINHGNFWGTGGENGRYVVARRPREARIPYIDQMKEIQTSIELFNPCDDLQRAVREGRLF